MINIINIIYIVIAVILIIKTTILIILTKKLLKRETKAVILRKDLDDDVITINPNQKSFNHKKEKYLAPNKEKEYVEIARKKYCFYEEGNPEPKNLYKEGNPIINAKSFYEVVETNALTQLNKGLRSGGEIDMKMIIVGVAVVIALFIFLG